MRTASLEYCCVSCPANIDRVSLRLEAWHIKMFPMTFTVQECLEDWCEEVGWRYISHRGGMSGTVRRMFYIATVELPMYDGITQTITRYVRIGV